jgi:hypothetical protein
MSAGGVAVARPASQQAGGGATPTPALHSSPIFGPKELEIKPISHRIARQICEERHYLGSYPGGSQLNFGVFVGNQLLGVAVLGSGPTNIHCLFRGAEAKQVLCLSRLWLGDRLERNAESRTVAIILRSLRRWQSTVKAIVAYSDPMAGQSGAIYRAAGFMYLGQSEVMPLYRLPNGAVYHSRSLSHGWATHSRQHFAAHGVPVELLSQAPKHMYVALIDPLWRSRLTRSLLPYPNKEMAHGDS